jgi:hypothetical protein
VLVAWLAGRGTPGAKREALAEEARL